MTLKANIKRVEKRLVIEALIRSRGNVRKAAADLDILYRTLWRHIKKHGIDIDDYRD